MSQENHCKSWKIAKLGNGCYHLDYETTQWEIITPSSSSSFISSFHSFLFHIDTHDTRPWWQSNRSWRCKISGCSITKQLSERSSLLLRLLPLFHHFTLFHFIQALTTLTLWNNQIGVKGAQYLAEALRNNSVRYHHFFFFFVFFLYFIISLFPISYRQSLHSSFARIKSEFKVHNT